MFFNSALEKQLNFIQTINKLSLIIKNNLQICVYKTMQKLNSMINDYKFFLIN